MMTNYSIKWLCTMTKTLKVTYLRETCVAFDKGKTYIATSYDPILKCISVIDESQEEYLYPLGRFKIHGDYKELPISINVFRE